MKDMRPLSVRRRTQAQSNRQSQTGIARCTACDSGTRETLSAGSAAVGKTAILRAATAAAERGGAVVIRLDAEAYPGVDGLVRAIVTESAQKLKSDVAKTGEKILRFFSRLRGLRILKFAPLEDEARCRSPTPSSSSWPPPR